MSYATAPRIPQTHDPEQTTNIWADRVDVEGQQLFRFNGNVQVARDDQTLSADAATYDKGSGEVNAVGNVHFGQGAFAAQGTRGRFNLEKHNGNLDSAKYQYDTSHAHGRAHKIIIEDDDVTRLKKATLTTCDPDDVVWDFQSSDVTLNKGTGWGHAFNVIFRIRDIPVFYFPYISFPISDKRKTGFLIPSFRSSNRSGLTFDIPYYLNIAPNLDATLTPHVMTKRGVQLESEVRYLTAASRGVVNVQYLPRDRVYGGDRAQLAYQDNTRILNDLNADVLVNYVTDKEYIHDFSNSLSASSLYYLENRFDLFYHHSDFTASGLIHAYQTVDNTVPAAARPYQQLPQLTFRYNPVITGRLFDQEYDLASEMVRFERQSSVTGDRIDLKPSLSLPMRGEAGFLVPKVTLHSTYYKLHNQGAGIPSDLVRTLPVASVDSGIFLERNVDWGSRHWLQTLEPRAFYLYIPYRDQSQIPIFDSGQPDLNMSQLFSDNRFSGADRIGDANQVSLGITTRFLQRNTGQELFRVGIGQIFFFRDRKVTLPGQAVEQGGTSDVVAETGITLRNDLTANGDLVWDRDTHDINTGNVELRYNRDSSHILNVGYRFIRQQLVRQTDISLVWPIYGYWRFVGRWNYSLHDKRSLETLAGVEYSSCCWGLRVLWRQFVTNVNGVSNSSLMLQFILKGMTSIGSSAETELQRAILGYTPLP